MQAQAYYVIISVPCSGSCGERLECLGVGFWIRVIG